MDRIAKRVAARFHEERTAAPRAKLDPTAEMPGNGVAYFDIDGDDESLSLRKGEVPVKVVTKYLERRVDDAKVTEGKAGELTVKFKSWNGEQSTFKTTVTVEARK